MHHKPTKFNGGGTGEREGGGSITCSRFLPPFLITYLLHINIIYSVFFVDEFWVVAKVAIIYRKVAKKWRFGPRKSLSILAISQI
jgi:hypothetical protein